MKKSLLLKITFSFFLLFGFEGILNSQTEECDFTIQTNVSNVTCPGNGIIAVLLEDTAGSLSTTSVILYFPTVRQ